MAKARTWIIVILSVIGFIVVCLMVLAGAGTMWMMRHINTAPSTATQAVKTFDEERARFGTEKALITLEDVDNGAAVQKRIDAMPTSTTKPTEMAILVWDPDGERTVRIALPFWLLKLGKKKIDIGSNAFDFDRFRIDVRALERIGPKLIAAIQKPGGVRVLVWSR
jgi:hypothetical protein